MSKKAVKDEIIIPISIGKYKIKIHCHIWEKKYQMLKFLKMADGFHGITLIKKVKEKKEYIEIHFWKGRLGIDYVVHELGHAAIIVSNILGLKIQTLLDQKKYVDEEIYVRLHGKMVRMFYEKLHEAEMINKPDFFKSRPLDKSL